MNDKSTGILLLAFGGPDSPEAIEPFMKNLMGGRTPSPALVEKVKARYGLIGGKSPLPDITRTQAEKLQQYLQGQGGQFQVEVGMRHWHPFISEGINKLLAGGAENLITMSLAPFFSQVSTGTYNEEVERVVSSLERPKPDLTMTEPLFRNPWFIKAVAERINEGLAGFPAEGRRDVPVIFSAHSLPVSYIENGDPYVEQFEFTVNQVVQQLLPKHWYMAYQSKGGGQGEWLGPMVEEVMEQIKNEGFNDVLVVPVGFVSDHIETLYDIDIAQKSRAVELGLNFHRAPSLNDSGLFIRALAESVLERCR